MVTVAVVGILTAITIPVLRSMAMRGHDAKNQSSLRSTHQHFRIYANDNNDYFVNAGRPKAPGLPIVVDFGPGNGWMAMHYFVQVWKWPAVAALHFGGAFPTWHSTHEPVIPEGNGRPGGIDNPRYAFETKFHYSQAMMANPFRFDAPGILNDFDAYRKVRWSEVAFPASKGLMQDVGRPQPQRGHTNRNVSFVDGSAALVDLSQAPPAPDGITWAGIPVTATPLGVLGRDVVR
jgi:prepilin-type processing-associated H-X9-DG protein